MDAVETFVKQFGAYASAVGPVLGTGPSIAAGPAVRNKHPAARAAKPFAVREAKGPAQGAWRVANQNRMLLAAKLRTNPPAQPSTGVCGV